MIPVKVLSRAPGNIFIFFSYTIITGICLRNRSRLPPEFPRFRRNTDPLWQLQLKNWVKSSFLSLETVGPFPSEKYSGVRATSSVLTLCRGLSQKH